MLPLPIASHAKEFRRFRKKGKIAWGGIIGKNSDSLEI
jgi:hypothetical protein